MNIIVSGSMAYDRIMAFPEYFADHILPDKIHMLNVCFQVDGVTEHFGGTAGNISYALRLMGKAATITATIGHDHRRYFKWLESNDIAVDGIKIIDKEFTAGAYITTDKADNQITGFNPGAMKFSSELDFDSLDPENTILIASPGNLDDMINYPRRCKEKSIRYIFDPGQALPVLQPEDLIDVITGSFLLIVNDYEFDLILNKTGLTREELLALADNTIITLGEHGSRIYRNGTETKIAPAAPRGVIDPTGCGDAYRGALLSGLASGLDLEESAKLGSICASFAVECHGTQVYTFTPEEFEDRRKSY
ncbi:carbohydrate kinase family protein [Desulfopila aestuarii]|uniref:Adenosine kinase n=1 Tax=Desulfopila aestuarii DSM 18488 TaxID=1121416 RepID=A0A1M7Y5I8_9BACT|nr:carbohydrate kinase family protein [Desulfopila aestuarii]SHO47814.1 adenosine kinase [Desulfopila aestuarii DSM 18488]